MDLKERDFDKFFYPKSVAIVGVSSTGFKFGGTSFLIKLKEAGFRGRIYPINPKAKEIMGLKAYPDLSSLPETPDLAMVSIPAGHVPGLLEECARIGLKHIHILTSGFREIGTEDGKRLEEQVAAISSKHKLYVIGPNCMGSYCPSSGLTAWGAIPGMSGPLGIISQSGGITQRLSEYACSLGVGVEKAVSIGNGAVLKHRDFLQYMAEDPKIKVIAMYMESELDAGSLMPIVRAVNKKKPVIILKGGESKAGAATVSSHTGNMAGEEKLWKAFFRQTGVIQVHNINEWADAVITFCFLPAPAGKGVFLAGGGGGTSVNNSDIFTREGLDVPRLSDFTMEKLRESVPAVGSIAGNPLDMFDVFVDTEYLSGVMDLMYNDPVISMIVVDRLIPRKAFHLPDMPDSTPDLIAFINRNGHTKPTVMMVDSEGGDPELAAEGARIRAVFGKAGIPSYPSPARAARSLYHLYRYYNKYSLEGQEA